MLVQHKASKDYYAMKILDKQKVCSAGILFLLKTNMFVHAGGQIKASGAHIEREENSPSDQLPIFSQPKVPF